MNNKIDDICSICLEDLEKNLAVLNCNHIYHFDCIKMWYKEKRKKNKLLNCPLCNNEYAEIINILYLDEPNPSSDEPIDKNSNESIEQEQQLRPIVNNSENPGQINIIRYNNIQEELGSICCHIL